MQPIFQALMGKPKKLQWDEKMISAFNLTKEALDRATMLAHPHADTPTAITVDASGVAVGAALEQLVNGSWQPLAFFSRQLRSPEKNTVQWSWAPNPLPGSETLPVFTAFIDHKPLRFSFAKVSNP